MRFGRKNYAILVVAGLVACGGGSDGTTPPGGSTSFNDLRLAPTTLIVRVGSNDQLTATPLDQRGNAIADASGITFSSSDQTKATVSAAGVVTGVAEGQVTVTASLTRDGVARSATSTVVVSNASVAAAVTVVASATSNVFTPVAVEVQRAGTVTFQFGGEAHNVVFSTSGSPADIPTTSNASVPRTFPNAGTFSYTCTLHAGMNGIVFVR
jgi:plastocyanin